MEIAVIGAGSVGLTTAYQLCRRGAAVTVFDAADTVGSGASFGNGGQLSYSFADGLAEPALLKRLPSLLVDADPAIRLKVFRDPSWWSWGARFLRNCLPGRSRRNSQELLALALRSAEAGRHLHERFGCGYGYRKAGKLVLLNETASAALRDQVASKQAAGCEIEILDADQVERCEPATASLPSRPTAAVFGAADAVGDARRYCVTLARELVASGVRVELSTPVQTLREEQGHIVGLDTDHGGARFDAIVLCTAGATNALTLPLGLRFPIKPVTGYSLTLPAGEQAFARIS